MDSINYLVRFLPLTAHSVETLAKTNLTALEEAICDQKLAKQIFNASKRICKKRAAPSGSSTAPVEKKIKNGNSTSILTPYETESRLSLPTSVVQSKIEEMTVVTNRAPLVLAFAICVLKYTMPEQPISSRLSLAQAVVSANSRSKAISIGIELNQSAEQEVWSEGQPVVTVLGREIPVLKRWDYDPREGLPGGSTFLSTDVSRSSCHEFLGTSGNGNTDQMPPLWGIDLEASQRSRGAKSTEKGATSLPIYTAESARSYLLRSISDARQAISSPKVKAKAALVSNHEEPAVSLLFAIDSVCQSWAGTLTKEELDRRAWFWYLKTRPEVEDGRQGWGQKGQVRLRDILALRKDFASTLS